MTTYYIEKNKKIVLFDTDRNKLVNSLKFMPQYKAKDIKETERPIENFEWADTEEHIAKKQKEELQSQVGALEQQTGLTRALREVITTAGLETSSYIAEKVAEIEELAEQLRG